MGDLTSTSDGSDVSGGTGMLPLTEHDVLLGSVPFSRLCADHCLWLTRCHSRVLMPSIPLLITFAFRGALSKFADSDLSAFDIHLFKVIFIDS